MTLRLSRRQRLSFGYAKASIRHSSNPNELNIEVSGSFKRILLILIGMLIVGTLIYLLSTAREALLLNVFISSSPVTEDRYADLIIHAPAE
ncbi:hypothetical protein [Paenibacillus sp. QZ-Y1]|uniref:hypothetical protein n=1 Tax=Paenibacillus sp. QZ-Y1 TaxID=3414511 RepID=UPI003F795A65